MFGVSGRRRQEREIRVRREFCIIISSRVTTQAIYTSHKPTQDNKCLIYESSHPFGKWDEYV